LLCWTTWLHNPISPCHRKIIIWSSVSIILLVPSKENSHSSTITSQNLKRHYVLHFLSTVIEYAIRSYSPVLPYNFLTQNAELYSDLPCFVRHGKSLRWKQQKKAPFRNYFTKALLQILLQAKLHPPLIRGTQTAMTDKTWKPQSEWWITWRKMNSPLKAKTKFLYYVMNGYFL